MAHVERYTIARGEIRLVRPPEPCLRCGARARWLITEDGQTWCLACLPKEGSGDGAESGPASKMPTDV